MRVAANPESEHFDPSIVGHVEVWIDGKPLDAFCTEFDSDEGWAILVLKAENGDILLNPETNEVATEKRFGKIHYVIRL